MERYNYLPMLIIIAVILLILLLSLIIFLKIIKLVNKQDGETTTILFFDVLKGFVKLSATYNHKGNKDDHDDHSPES